ncbi:hypothetical protein CJF30_00007527 [Rutstroemia sp. NJR-2017a BBW]|nr:hypothetical protein CJF30_00007527 [Rutstroemia sp. NJR-2017a BBW]
MVEHELSPTTRSSATIQWLKNILDTCQTEHKDCREKIFPKAQNNFRPTRVLDIQQNDTNTIRLVVTSELPTATPLKYTALSHCWGGSVTFLLLEGNLTTMQQSIPVANLSKNFQDAIIITREIGQRYLWIDSLCIMQDSTHDWLQESPTMGLVYANAICTISATASKDSTGGCFFPKNPLLNDCILRKSENYSLVVRSPIGDNIGLTELFERKVEHAPLSQRAWTFQERSLSTRVLHFCDGFVLFECNTLQASEYHLKGVPYPRKAYLRADGTLHSSSQLERLNRNEESTIVERKKENLSKDEMKSLMRGNIDLLFDKHRANEDYQSKEHKIARILEVAAHLGIRGAFRTLLQFSGTQLAEKIEFHYSWYEMVEAYSIRALTEQKDKIMAIAGVGSFIQQRTGFQFLAGLWRQTLAFNLLWTLLGSPKVRPARQFPTWSWASVDGRIYHRLTPSPSKLEQLSTSSNSQLSHFPNDDASRPTDLNKEFETTWEEIQSLIEFEDVQEVLEINSLVHSATLVLSCYLLALNLSKLNFVHDIVLPDSVENFICMPILSFKNTKVHPEGSPLQLHGIVLRAKPGVAKEYERIGYFWTAKEMLAKKVLRNLGDKISGIRIV